MCINVQQNLYKTENKTVVSNKTYSKEICKKNYSGNQVSVPNTKKKRDKRKREGYIF